MSASTVIFLINVVFIGINDSFNEKLKYNIENCIFQNSKTTTATVLFENVFNDLLQKSDRERFFQEEYIKNVSKTFVLEDKLNTFKGYLYKISYKNNKSNLVYQEILEQITSKLLDTEDALFPIFKPGLFILLDNLTDEIIIIRFNLCAMESQKNKIYNCLKQDKYFSKILIVQCGVHNFEIVK